MEHLARRRRLSALVLGALITLSSCAGGGGTSGLPPHSNPGTGNNQTAQLVVKGSLPSTGGPQLYAHRTRLPHVIGGIAHPNVTFTKINITGTVYPADASAYPITASVTASPPPSGQQYSGAVAFSNVPVHKNEWAILQFTGVAGNGSTISLGELAGIINVTANPNTTTLTNATTLTFEVFGTLLATGSIASLDLDNDTPSGTGIATTINNAITSTAVQPDPVDGLYDSAALAKLVPVLMPTWERDAVITPSMPSKNIVIERDYTNASELNLVSNVDSALSGLAIDVDSALRNIPQVIGGSAFGTGVGEDCGSFVAGVPGHTPDTAPLPVPQVVDACVIPSSGALTIKNVYGGALLVGATDNAMDGTTPSTPFNGGWVSQAAHAPGNENIAVTMADMSMPFTVTDATGFAYGPASFTNGGLFSMNPDFTNTPMGATQFEMTPLSGSSSFIPYRFATQTPYGPANNVVTIDTFNPWRIPAGNLDFCGGITCFASNAGSGTFTRAFIDPGNKLTYRAWAAGGGATAISQATGSYKVTLSLGATDATLTSTKATVLLPQQPILISNTLPPGTTWTLTATDTSNKTYTNSATNGFDGAEVTMFSVGAVTNIKQIVLKATFPGAGSSFNIGPVESPPSF